MDNHFTTDELAALLDHKPATARPIDINDLAPQPTQPLAYLNWMISQLARITYKPNWEMMIQIDGSLIVRYLAVDSRNPGHPRRFEAHRALTPTNDPNTFAAQILDRLDNIEKHETREWFRVDGQLFADEHADPTRWHCTNCAGVGPTRHEGNTWQCPGCGHTTTTKPAPENSPGAASVPVARAQDELDQADRDAFRRLARRMGPAAFDAAYNAVMAVPGVSDDPRRENGRVWRAVEAALDGWAIVPDPRAIANPAAAAASPGDVTVIGPECFASNDGAVICWRGRNYVPQTAPAAESVNLDELLFPLLRQVVAEDGLDISDEEIRDGHHRIEWYAWIAREAYGQGRDDEAANLPMRYTAEAGSPVQDTEETAENAAQRFAAELSRLTEGLAQRGIAPAPETPAGEAPVTTALAELDRLRTVVEGVRDWRARHKAAEENPPVTMAVLNTLVDEDLALNKIVDAFDAAAAQSTSERAA